MCAGPRWIHIFNRLILHRTNKCNKEIIIKDTPRTARHTRCSTSVVRAADALVTLPR